MSLARRLRFLVPPSIAVVLPGLLAVGCIVRHVAVKPMTPRAADSVTVTSPVKAHLRDGSTVSYPAGFVLSHGIIRGSGSRVDLSLHAMPMAASVPLDSVVGMESYTSDVNVPATILLSSVATAAVVAAAGAAAVAIFGSCPTFYSDSAGTPRLEAEGFSYSIAPLFEGRDVDRLRAVADSDGSVRLDVRNEADETHYINQLALLDVAHAAGEFVVPDPTGRPIAARGLTAPRRAVDRAGRNLTATLAAADGKATHSDSAVLARASAADFEDHIDLTFAVPPGADSVALVLRVRNSLLNTVLLYEGMLGDGARSLDWLGRTMHEIGPAVETGEWYTGTMGLRVLLVEGDSTRAVAHVRDTGPIAWKDVAVMLPAPAHDSIRVRLAYVVDDWRIDRAALGPARRADFRVWPVDAVLGADGRPDTAALRALHAPDAQYLETHPGQRFTAVWRPGRDVSGAAHTFMLVSQGYYTEWMRPAWLAQPRDTAPFRPSRAALATAIRRYRVEQHALEAKFRNSRLPTR